ncbi:MAG: PAS domain-containing protein [Deltaproteobacteria bacterium]|nr:PAS domain-containing protein [Deltaproteobacteria bacterium]
MRAVDWSATSVGAPDHWPQSLRTALSILLETRFAMYIAWGRDYTQFYNDAYRPILGSTKHPAAMGRRTSETFAESWQIIGPMFDQVMQGIAVGADDWMLPLDRHGFLEECFFCYSYSPIRDEAGEVGGVLVTVNETTARVLGERRLKTRQAVSARLLGVSSADEAYAATMSALADNVADLPFAAVYVRESDGMRLASAAPNAGSEAPALAAVEKVARTQMRGIVGTATGTLLAFPLGASAVLVVGASPRLHLDDAYQAFFGAVADDLRDALERVQTASDAKSRQVQRELAALLESAKLRDLFEQAPAGVAVFSGPQHRFEVANEVYRAITNHQQLVGKTYVEAFPELIGTALPGVLDQVYATGEPFVANEYPVLLDLEGDGVLVERFYRFHLTPVRETDGAVSGLMATAMDVTEQVVARCQAQLAEHQLAFALEAAQLGPWDLDLVAGSARRSPRHDQIFGYDTPLPEWTFDTFLAHVEPAYREAVNATFQRARDGAADWVFEAPIIAGDGSRRWIAAHGRTVLDTSGAPERMLGIVADITERKQAEEERRSALDREQAARGDAEAANRAKDEFLAMLGHELRTPLNAITGWARMLLEGAVPEAKRQHAIEVIDRNANAQAQLIEDLLDVSRIISGKVRIEARSISPMAPVEAAIESVRPTADAKGVLLQIALDATVEPVMGDVDRLQQVVWNLLNNAIKFTPRGGRVLVGLRRQDADVVITVDDDGQGIKPEFMPYMFERFRQEDGAFTRSRGGLGLGLAIARHLVELHGGTIRAHSEGEGKGASFVVTLPIIPSQARRLPGSSAPAPSRAPRLLDGVHVLVVDDEPDARDMVANMLENARAKVTIARNAAEARAILQRERPDVIVCDIGMPEEDGFSLIRTVRASSVEHGSRIAAVALTAYARAVDRTAALVAGFDLHVPKPVDPSELVVVVANLAARGLRP